MPVELISQHPQVGDALLSHCRKTALQLLRMCGVPGHELNVVLTTDAAIAELNSKYRNKSGATNVLSFPFDDSDHPFLASISAPHLGDLIISYDRALAEARDADCSSEQRLDWLIVHGLLHLLGYDHERSPEDGAIMLGKEEELLSELKTNRRIIMPHLAVNVDHVATIRQARGI